MSCDHNREKYLKKVAAELGVTAAHLESVFQSGRRAPANEAEALAAEARTRLLFVDIERVGYRPPTHSKSGLPRKDAQMGYAALMQEISRLRLAKASKIEPVLAQTEKALRLQVDDLNVADLSVEQIAAMAEMYERNCRDRLSRERSDTTPPLVNAQQEANRLERNLAGLRQRVESIVGGKPEDRLSDCQMAPYVVDFQEITWALDALRSGGPTVSEAFLSQIESQIRSLRGKVRLVRLRLGYRDND